MAVDRRFVRRDLDALVALVVHVDGDSCLGCLYRWVESGEAWKASRDTVHSRTALFADDGSVPGPTPQLVESRAYLTETLKRVARDIRHAVKSLESDETALRKVLERSDPAHASEEVKAHANARLPDEVLSGLKDAKRRRESRGEGWGAG